MGKALWYGGGVQFHDNAGDPLAGGKIYTYEVGTTTPKTAYQDSDLTTPHANPIILDAYGRPPSGQIWFDGDTKALVYDADDVLITPVGGDNLNPDAEGFGSWADKDSGVLTKTAAYTVAVADDGKVIVATSGTWTLTLPAAATAGDGGQSTDGDTGGNDLYQVGIIQQRRIFQDRRGDDLLDVLRQLHDNGLRHDLGIADGIGQGRTDIHQPVR